MPLKNKSFEGGWTRVTHSGVEYGEIFTPEGWVTWWNEDKVVPWDLSNKDGFGRPEVHVINKVAPFLDPPRIFDGQRSLKMFTFYRAHECGVYQTIDVTPGSEVIFDYDAHAWTSTSDDPRHSEYNTPDSADQAQYYAGIDPTGGTDPWSEDIIWGEKSCIYDTYKTVSPAMALAESSKVTLFIKSVMKFPFKHCDSYIDDVQVTVTEPVVIPDEPIEIPDGDYNGEKVMFGSLLTGHFISEGVAMEFLDECNSRGFLPSSIKALAPQNASELGWLRKVKTKYPSVITVARLMRLPSGLNVEGPDIDNPAGSARAVFNEMKPIMAEYHDCVDYWEIVNELDDNKYEQRNLAVFYREFIELLNAENLPHKLSLFSYSVGVPEAEEIETIFDTGVMALASEHGHSLSLHEYSDVPWDGYVAGRFENWIDVMEERGQWCPIYITEYNSASILSSFTEEDLIDLWEGYDRMCRTFPNVISIQLFTFGRGMGWDDTFLCDPYLLALVDYMEEVKDEQNYEEMPIPECYYDRTVLVCDATLLNAEELDICYAHGRDLLITTTPSNDDASLWPADACSNTVIIPGVPMERRDEFLDWYDYRNPETGVVFDDTILGETPLPFPWTDISDSLPTRTDFENFTDPEIKDTGWAITDTKEINGVTVHHLGGDWTPQQVAAYHLNRDGGTPSIHYHLWIDYDGTVYKVAPFEWRLWHDHTWDYATHANYHLGVVIRGNLCLEDMTPEQHESLCKVLEAIVESDQFSVREDNIKGHRDRSPVTQCPCTDEWKICLGVDESPSLKGVHLEPVTSPPENPAEMLGWLKERDMKWVVVLAEGLGSVEWCKTLIENGIEPVVRFYQARQFPNRNNNVKYTKDYVDVGVQYFQPGNEPNLKEEHADESKVTWQDNSYVNLIAENWWLDAQDIISAGGKAGLLPMAPTDRDGKSVNHLYSGVMWAKKIYTYLHDMYEDEMFELLSDNKVWMAVHVAMFDKPMDTTPYHNAVVDDTCLLYYEVPQEWFYDDYGIVPVTISTEGGVYTPEHMAKLTYAAPYEDIDMPDLVESMYNFLYDSRDCTGFGLRAMCSWILYAGRNPEWEDGAWIKRNGNILV